MNKLTIYIIIAAINMGIAGSAAAQDTQESTKLSLQSAIDNAIRHRDEIKIQEANAAVSRNEVSKFGSRLLPTLTGDLDSRYNGKLQTNVIPGDAFGSPGSPSRKVAFGTTYNTTASFNLTVPVYNPTDFSDRKIAKIQAAYDEMNVEKSAIDVKVDVTQSYFNGLINQEKLKLAQANMTHTEQVYTVAKDQLAKGSITTNDLEKNRIDFENARSDYNKSKNNLAQAMEDLKYRMGIDSMLNPILTDKLTELYFKYHDVQNQNLPLNRVELKQQKVQEDIYQANITKQNKAYLPTVSLYGNLTDQNLNNSLSLFSHDSWYPYNYVGIKISVPIFDGFLKKRTKKGYELQLQSARLTTDKLNRDYNYDLKNTRTSLKNDQQDLDNQINNLKQAEDLYKTDADRYQKGAIKATDLTGTYYTLQQTENNYLNAVYTYLLDVIQYKKALGTL